VKSETYFWDKDGSALVEGSSVLRELNRKLGLALPLDGPKTLNGLILEHLRDIPAAGVALKIADVPMEIVQTQDRVIKTVRLFRPPAYPTSRRPPEELRGSARRRQYFTVRAPACLRLVFNALRRVS